MYSYPHDARNWHNSPHEKWSGWIVVPAIALVLLLAAILLLLGG